MAGTAEVLVVDVAALRESGPDGVAAGEATERIGAACSRSGFFVVVGHGLDAELVDVMAAARRFFALPLAVKERSAMIDLNGYAGIGSARAGGKEMLGASCACCATRPTATSRPAVTPTTGRSHCWPRMARGSRQVATTARGGVADHQR